LEVGLVSLRTSSHPGKKQKGPALSIANDRVAHQLGTTLQEKAQQAQVALSGSAFVDAHVAALEKLSDYVTNLDRDDGRLHALWNIAGARGIDMDSRYYDLSEPEQTVVASLGRPIGTPPDESLNSLLAAGVQGALDHLRHQLAVERGKAEAGDEAKTRLEAANERITELEAERDDLLGRVATTDADASDYRSRYQYLLTMVGGSEDGPNGEGASVGKPTPQRRKAVEGEPHLYSTVKASGDVVFEVGWRDSDGRQRWKRIGSDLEEARRLRDELIGAKRD
jgi:hypothetical protein